ncbi:uncharacterized protein [Procambarus clarkii]|uniref:uncharacterized protein n=1 Tax=Procambarus clarkii TaxID=6728 RepID=UPI001E6715CF|nr:uncharacterized protein LOC123747350 [Procambarus clarkii]
MKVVTQVLLTATLLGAACARPQHRGATSGALMDKLLVALQEMLARVVCGWESACVAHTNTACFRSPGDAARLVVAFTNCRSVVPATFIGSPGEGEAQIATKMKQCLRNLLKDKADVFLDCVARS